MKRRSYKKKKLKTSAEQETINQINRLMTNQEY